MKYLLLVLLSSMLSHAQSSRDNMYSITYLNSFKDRLSQNYQSKEYSRLLVSGNQSIYQLYNVMELDSLLKKGTVTDSDYNRYFSHNKHTINISDNTIKYRDEISEEVYSYEEKLNLNWTLGQDTKLIKGYSCKSATVTYGGRQWKAWYTLDLPISFGPYKFKGLPGLIVKITDSTQTYDFELYAIVERKLKPLEKYFKKPDTEIIKTDRLTFNKVKASYESLSLNEKLNYNNLGGKIKIFKADGNTDESLSFRNPKRIEKSKDLNLIEVDYKK